MTGFGSSVAKNGSFWRVWIPLLIRSLAAASFLAIFYPSSAYAQPYVYVLGRGAEFGCNRTSVFCFYSRLHVLDTATNQIISSLDLPVSAEAFSNAHDLALTPSGSKLYVTHGVGHGYVAVIDTTTNQILKRITGLTPWGVAVSTDGAVAFVATTALSAVGEPTQTVDQITLIDTSTDTIIGSIPVGLDPQDVVVGPDGHFVYVSNISSNTVSVIDRATLTVVVTVAVGTWPDQMALSPDGARLYVANARSVSVVATASNIVIATIPFASSTAPLRDVVVSPDGTRLFVSVPEFNGSGSASVIAVIDTATNQVIQTIAAAADGLATLDGTHLYGARAPSSVDMIDVSQGTVTGTIRAVGVPSRLEVAPSGVTPPTDPCTGSLEGVEGVYYAAGFAPNGFAGAVVRIPERCTWSLASGASWLQIPSNVSGLGPDRFLLVVAANTSNRPRFGTVTLTTPAGNSVVPVSQRAAQTTPRMVVDTPRAGQTLTQPFVLSGWAVEEGALAAPGIDVVVAWAYPSGGGAPILVGTATYGIPRSDIAALLGAEYVNSGFALTVRGLPSGTYQFVVYAYNNETFSFNNEASVTVTVTAPQPLMVVDTLTPNASVRQPFLVGGWAFDPSATSGPGVDAIHVWAYPASGPPTFLGAAPYGGARPDVGAFFGAAFTNSGFELPVNSLAPGAYRIVVHAHSSVTGTFNNVSVVPITVTVPASNPQMVIDVPSNGAVVTSGFTLSGWALDLGAAAGVGVDVLHVWAYPAGGGAPVFLTAVDSSSFGARSDVGAIFGSQFLMSGFTTPGLTLAPGVYDVVAFARSTMTGTFNNARVVRLTVQ